MENIDKKIKNIKSIQHRFYYNNTFKTNKSATNFNFDLENNNKKYQLKPRHFSYGTSPIKKKQFIWKMKKDKLSKKTNYKLKHLFEKLNLNNYDEVLEYYLKIRRRIVIIDLIIMSLIDIFSVIFSMKSYKMVLKNAFKLNSKINYYRLLNLGLSFLAMIILIIRRLTYKDLKIIKYILNIKLTYPSLKINYKKLFLEFLIHFIQPYPYLTHSYIEHNNQNNDFTSFFSIDLILVVLSFLRLYTLSRIILPTTNYRNIRIWKFYGNKGLYSKKFKKFIQDRSILFYFIILMIFVSFSSFLYSLFENIIEDEYRLKLYNCLWIITQSIIDCGYGDKRINTFPSKFYLIVIISLGLFLFSSFIISCLRIFEFPSENELKAYQKIKVIYSKNEKNNSYNLYFEHYLKYKMTKVKESLKSFKSDLSYDNHKIRIAVELKSPSIHIKNKNLFRTLDLKNQLKALKEKYYLSILAKLKFEPTISDFFNYIIKRFDVKIEKCNDKTNKNIRSLTLLHNYICEGITEYYHNVVEVFYDSNKLTNLMLLIFWTGCKFTIKNYDELIKYKVVQLKDFDIKYKEFKLIFGDRQIECVKGYETRSSRFYNNSDLHKEIENYQNDYEDDDFDIEDYEIDDSSELVSLVSSNHHYFLHRKKFSNGASQ